MLSTYNETNIAYSEKKDETPHPILALVFYGKGSDQKFVGVTRHDITSNRMQQGQYIDPNEVKTLLHTDEEKALVLTPHNLIAENDKYLIWYTPSRLQKMWFRFGTKQHAPNVHWTPLIFITDKQSSRLKVFALEQDNHPTGDTMIYHAPLMNIGINGDVCQGTATLPKDISYNTMKDVEDTIFRSNFTHVNHKSTLKVRGKTDISSQEHLKFWLRKGQTKKPVTKRSLTPHKTLNEIISSLN